MRSIECVKCKNLDVVMRGKRYNKTGVKQLYRCNDCRSIFVEPDGFERMRHKKEDIVRAIHMHNDGLSLYKTQYHLRQHYDVNITRRTISQWTKKYGLFLKSASSNSKTH